VAIGPATAHGRSGTFHPARSALKFIELCVIRLAQIFRRRVFAVDEARTVNVGSTPSTFAIRPEVDCAVSGKGGIPLAAGTVDRSSTSLDRSSQSQSFPSPNIESGFAFFRDRAIRDEVKP
jgi:hypothetical protein